MGVHVTPDTAVRAPAGNSNADSKTIKFIVQYYYVVLCEFESERKWIVGALDLAKIKSF